MWPRNDGTYITPQDLKTPGQMDVGKQAAEIAYLTALSRGGNGIAQAEALRNYAQNVNIHASNGQYNPEDELDVTDSEFENDSEFDSELDDDSEQENAAVIAAVNNNFQQNPHTNYNAAAINNMQMQSHNANNSVDTLTALAQLTALANPAFSMASQTVTTPSKQTIVNTLSQQSTPQAHWKPNPSNVQAMYMQQHYGYQHTGYNHAGVKSSDQNGNSNGAHQRDDKATKIVREQPTKIVREQPTKVVQPNNSVKKNFKRQSVTNTTVPKDPTAIRPRTQTQRREAALEEHLMQMREMEESFTSIESASPSRIKDMTASLKRIKLPRSQFSKISQLFHRNKTSSNNLTDTLPVISPQDELDGMGESQKIKTSEESLIPSENISLWINSEHQADLLPTSSSDEICIQALHFRHNFPDHFLGIRLLGLGIEDVQQIIQQVDLFESVKEKLCEIVVRESLGGPALMSCDFIELRKSLDLNLGTWTIFEQLITGLRHIQNNELLKMGIQKQTNLDKGLANNAEQMIDKNVFKDDLNTTQWTNLSSELQRPELLEENIVKEEASKDLSHGEAVTTVG